jgi:hypothetical protein
MVDENENKEAPDYKPLTTNMLIKAIAILFVLAIYIFIFLKILILP